ncbi:MAG: DUF58 domain-containing protein [Dictyoglomaceae bacterium]|nr:DUF58 domain-containing protein [Dictyoglomaceae bacterium]
MRVNFTLLGFFLFVGNLLITFIGINVSSVPLILMSSFIYGLFIFSFLELIFQPVSLKLELMVPSLVEENKEETIFIKIRNDLFISKGKFFIVFRDKFIPCNIKGKEEKYFNFVYSFKKRGIEEFKNIWLKFTGAFGLLYIKKYFKVNAKTLVYPTYYQVYKEIIIPGDSGFKASISSFARFGEEIHSLRKYVQGDPLKIIAWKVSAKKGELISKQFEKLSIFEPVFLLDNSMIEVDSTTLEEFDQLLRFLHSITLSSLRQGLKVKIRVLSPWDLFIPQNWDDLKVFLAKIEMKKVNHKEIDLNENFDLIFSLDYDFWERRNCLHKKFLGVEFHKKNIESSLYIFKKDDNPYDFLNLWSINYE